MKHFEWTWYAEDKTRLYAQCWQPDGAAKGVVCLVHGLGEHSSRYAHVAAALAEAGYVLLTFDLRGHGKSQGARGDVASYDTHMDDIKRLIAEAGERYPALPRFLYGHSMGGNLAPNYALRRSPQLQGVIATGPWLRAAFDPPAWRVRAGRALHKLRPALPQPAGLDVTAVSRDPAVVRAYQDDPLNHDTISLRMYFSGYQAGVWALERAAEFALPLLLMHGGADRLTSAAASREFAAKIKHGCTYKEWVALFHEIHNEPEQQQVFAFMIDWLNAHSLSPRQAD
ncbi:MAG TPA: alpha/beta hydrolase [Roseiflexaceae bacterium]|nr:alpha/beta hydrolase [Roseiflexaceae bacterium]